MLKTNIVLAGLLATLVSFGTASARRVEVLHSFTGGDGSNPQAALTLDPSGALYGTAAFGGAGSHGTVFRFGGDFSTLHDFLPAEGNPSGPLLRESNGRFLGLTEFFDQSPSGTVFEIGDDGSFTLIHTFADDKVGYAPLGKLIADGQGNLYGATVKGGANGLGTIFKLKPNGKAVPLYAFNQSDGYNTDGYLLADGAGNLYGTTSATNFQLAGSVFKIAPDGTFTKLHQFANGSDGGIPSGGLVMDAQGNLYGTTYYGGANLRGVLFKLAPDGTETVLHDFSESDGAPTAGVIADAAGNLYGTTLGGGGTRCNGEGCGNIFVLMTTGKFDILYRFKKRQGAGANYPLTTDMLGTFYGVATYCGMHDNGTVFELKR